MLSRDSVYLSKLQRNPNKCVKYKLKKNNLSITRNREVKQFYIVPINDDEFSLSWSPSALNVGCIHSNARYGSAGAGVSGPIESNPGPTTPSTPQFSSLFNTTKRIQLKLIRYQHPFKNYNFYTANNIIPKSLLPRCIPAFDTIYFWFYKQWRNICRLTARRHLILLTKECRRKIKHLRKELTFYKNRLAEHCNAETFSFHSTGIDSMASSLESLLADRRAHKNHLTNQTSRPNNNTPTPSPAAPTQAVKTRNRRKRKPRKTHKTTNLDTTSVTNYWSSLAA